MSDQLTLDLPRAAGCQYGLPQPGQRPLCDRPATHAAVSVHRSGHVARVECCRSHANYYASAWAAPHVRLYPVGMMGDATWIDILPT